VLRRSARWVLALVAMGGSALAAEPAKSPPPALQGLEALYPELDALYRNLHQSPELSTQEEKTAAKMAERLRALGFEVTQKVGGHGVVGILRNGKGPTVMLRACR
jgi:metal-dependent amidase/aminoacylase/carboxypeptidase family protein